VFLLGAPLALIPATAFLPAFVLFFLRYTITGAPWQASMFAALAFAPVVFLEVLGSVLLGFAGFESRLSYLTLLAGAAMVLLVIVSAYTGLFFGFYAGSDGFPPAT